VEILLQTDGFRVLEVRNILIDESMCVNSVKREERIEISIEQP